jgi:hypothetical protein
MQKKYKLTTLSKVVNNHTLYQIQALVNIPNICSIGDLGGWLESEKNLSHYDNCWVSGNALVYGSAQVCGDAEVYGNAKVFGDALVYGNARVFGNALVYGDARVCGNARVFGNALVYGDARKPEIKIDNKVIETIKEFNRFSNLDID